MTTTLAIPNIILRLMILAIGAALAFWVAWGTTPDLDAVERRLMYRIIFYLFLLNGWSTIWFRMLDVFPVD